MLGEMQDKHLHSTVMLKELLALPCSFSARQRYCPSPWGVISTISSTDSSSAVMVPTSSPSFSQVRVGAGLPWVLQCKASVDPSSIVMESFTTGSRGGSATFKEKIIFVSLPYPDLLSVSSSFHSYNTLPSSITIDSILVLQLLWPFRVSRSIKLIWQSVIQRWLTYTSSSYRATSSFIWSLVSGNPLSLSKSSGKHLAIKLLMLLYIYQLADSENVKSCCLFSKN